MMEALREELELMEYLKIEDGKASVTGKGEERFQDFRAGLAEQEQQALHI
jgi:hypothetical protein